MTLHQGCSKGKKRERLIHSPLDIVQGSLVKLPMYKSLEDKQFIVSHAEENIQFVLIKGEEFLIGTESKRLAKHSGAFIYSLPIGSLLSVKALSNAVEVIVMDSYPTFNLCLGACPNSVGALTADAELKVVGRKEFDESYRALPMSNNLLLWFETVKAYLAEEYTDLFMFELKLQEFYRLLNLDYTRASLNEFIGDIHCKASGFRRKVFALKGNPILLEDLGDYLGMSNSLLKRRFLAEFGMPPQKWLALQRSRYIFRDIIGTDVPIKDIADQYEFSSTSYLSLFCKKYLGDTPQNIRKAFLSCKDEITD